MSVHVGKRSITTRWRFNVKRSPRVLSMVSCLLVMQAFPLFGCGDKYLLVGRGSRFQRGYVSIRPVSIAVFNHDEAVGKDFVKRLKLAGHRVQITEDLTKLASLVDHSKADVVLAGYSDASIVDKALQNSPRKPLFLPVVDATSIDAAAAQKEYGCLLNRDSKQKQQNVLAILDQVVAATREAKPVQCDLTKM